MMQGGARNPVHAAVAACVGLLLCLAGLPNAAAGQRPSEIALEWRSVGIGGGGGMFYPAISPHDAHLLFIACDMGGIYRSSDGGNSWRMIDGYQARKAAAPPVFDPRDPAIVYLAVRGGIKRSRNGGITWEHLVGRFDPLTPDMPTALAVDPADPAILWAAFDTYLGQKGHSLVRSLDGGATWSLHPGWRQTDRSIQKIIFDRAGGATGRRVFLWSAGALLRSDDDGLHWREMTKELPSGGPQNDCAAAWDAVSGNMTLVLTLPSAADIGACGGVYISKDRGETWRRVDGLPMQTYKGEPPQYQLLAISPNRPDILYVSSKGGNTKPPQGSTVWRSIDGGTSWQAVLFGEPHWFSANVEPDWLTRALSWWWGGTALGLACNPGDPNELIFTDHGRAIRSTDGGKHWSPISSAKMDQTGRSWNGRGLETSTSYQYYFDPFERNRTYITYTDFGLARSLDGGRSWIWSGQGSPWTNTCYALVFDPDRPGVAFGAWSAVHDLPHWKMIRQGKTHSEDYRGGLNRSDDFCETWRPLRSRNLPEAPATTIVLDSNSPHNARTLYAGLFGKGVYKSIDDGRSWEPMNNGLGTPGNDHIWRLELHRDGTLVCAETLAYSNLLPVPGGLFRSRDGGSKLAAHHHGPSRSVYLERAHGPS